MHSLSITLNQHVTLWPFVLLLAWCSGEFAYKLFKIPQISSYVLIGFLLAHHQLNILPTAQPAGTIFLINIAVGLILFEFGYRINLHWLKNNPHIIATGFVESICTFLAIFTLTKLFGFSTMLTFEFSALAIATSPVVIMYLINHQHSAGQVTERIIHLTAINCIIAIFIFKLGLGLLIFEHSGSLWQATWASIWMIALSVILGATIAIFLSSAIHYFTGIAQDRTIAFAILVILIVAIAQSCGLSPIMATLSFGLVSRHKKIAMGAKQRNFGALGELLTVMLFITIPSSLNWHGSILLSLWLAGILVIARLLAKTLVVTFFSHYGGISWTKSFLTGIALNPISVLSILFLEQSNYAGAILSKELSSLTAVILLLEILGPIMTGWALNKAKESGGS